MKYRWLLFLLMPLFCNGQGADCNNSRLLELNAVKTKVLYIGVDNPVTISTISPANASIKLTLDGPGKIIADEAAGLYTANVTQEGKCKIIVSGLVNGEYKKLSSDEYLVKKIPDPRSSLGGKLFGGNCQPATIKAQSGIVAVLWNFDFNVSFSVLSYRMLYSSKGEITQVTCSGPLLNDEMVKILDQAKPKDVVVFDNIVVVGPDGEKRKLGQIAFTII